MHVVSYDSQRRSLKVRLDDRSVLIDGLADDVLFRKQGRGRPEQLALWLDHNQAEVLAKMIDYILKKVRISEPSRQALEEVLPEVDKLVHAHGTPSPGHPGEPPSQPTGNQAPSPPDVPPGGPA